jgi:hypothetical protein
MFFSRYLSASLICSANRRRRPGAVLGGGHLGLVEDLDGDRVADVDQRRKADQVCPPLRFP